MKHSHFAAVFRRVKVKRVSEWLTHAMSLGSSLGLRQLGLGFRGRVRVKMIGMCTHMPMSTRLSHYKFFEK
jgi:hypothetical protein